VPDLFVLNMETEQFEFMVPPVNGQLPPSLTAHTADIVGNYMVVAFGNITQPNASPLPLKNSNIYIMDIRNYTWVNSFEVASANITTNPDPTTNSSPTIVVANNSNSDLVTMKIIIAAIGGTVGAVIIIACGFLFYRWNRSRNEQRGFINGEQHNLPG
ncbi:15354_t:CDS:2, partial [Funneliformis geosporum]